MFSPSLEVREIFREASLGDSRESIDPVNSEHSSDSSPANSSSHQSWSSCKELAQEGTGRTALPMYVKSCKNLRFLDCGSDLKKSRMSQHVGAICLTRNGPKAVAERLNGQNL